MTRCVRGLLLGGALLAAVAVVTAARAADEDEKEVKAAQKDILDLTSTIEAGKGAKAIDAKVAAIKKKNEELGTLMHIYKPRNKGGLGFGPVGTSGLESKIRELSKRKLAAGALEKQTKELIRMSYVNIAMADVTKHYFAKPKNGKGKKEWDEYLTAQKKAAQDLIAAVKAKDTTKIKEVANNLDSACNNCHSDFRD